MANYGYVCSPKRMHAERIHEIIVGLNESHFKNTLTIDRTTPLEWHITCTINDVLYAYRSCWLGSIKRFTMRHGGGGHFAWWVDAVILNAVALEYSGTIRDDGHDGRHKGKENCYPELEDYVRAVHAHSKRTPEDLERLIQQTIEDCAPELFWPAK